MLWPFSCPTALKSMAVFGVVPMALLMMIPEAEAAGVICPGSNDIETCVRPRLNF
jgi:hypothetical protein